ncbi:uncharacterized protein [Spinacia oleracea]|uniref:Uncharacterized protein n=1 Tax=Spinacia oleracea TaxID=3562 RepID=A0ABM3RS74_SPIOL|nr:uncharacterized protein LOC130472070 [Spinacia oleracea]
MEFCKSWKTRTAEELKAQVAESTHHGDYAFKSIEEVRLQMQTTIDLQAKEVASLRSYKAELLKKILAQDKDMVTMVEEAKTAAAEIRTLQDQLREYPQVKEAAEEAEHLRGELETARSQVRTLRERLLESYDQGEQAAKDAVKHAWESHMPEIKISDPVNSLVVNIRVVSIRSYPEELVEQFSTPTSILAVHLQMLTATPSRGPWKVLMYS